MQKLAGYSFGNDLCNLEVNMTAFRNYIEMYSILGATLLFLQAHQRQDVMHQYTN